MNEVRMYQSNVLTEARYDVNRIQKNCLYKIIEKVRQDYVENHKSTYENLHVTLPPSVLEDITDKKHKQEVGQKMTKWLKSRQKSKQSRANRSLAAG